jgi:hypothetical protein
MVALAAIHISANRVVACRHRIYNALTKVTADLAINCWSLLE